MYLCLLGILAPRKLIAAEVADNEARKNFSGKSEREPNALIVRRAFWSSLGFVLASSLVGAALGALLTHSTGCSTQPAILILQLLGAALLLWGTLFVRGWDIQTWSGVTLTERVNRWLYRTMYCMGTAIFVCSLFWKPCGR